MVDSVRRYRLSEEERRRLKRELEAKAKAITPRARMRTVVSTMARYGLSQLLAGGYRGLRKGGGHWGVG